MSEKMVKVNLVKLDAIEAVLRYVWMASRATHSEKWLVGRGEEIEYLNSPGEEVIIPEKQYKSIQELVKYQLKKVKETKEIVWWAKPLLDQALDELKKIKVEHIK